MVVLFSALILGPILTTSSIKAYFSDISFFKYLKTVFLFKIYYNLPGVFAHNPYPDAVNGALWSLPVEFCMYILVALFGLFNLFNKKYLYPTIFASCFILFLFVFTGDWVDKNFIWAKGNWFFQLMAAFFIASSMYTYRDKIKLSLPVFFGFLVVYFIGQKTDYRLLIHLLTLPYLVIYFAYAKIPFINKWGTYGDFSYGIYVWAFPVQQTISCLMLDKLNIYSYMAITFAITLLCGILSFKLIEKPALDLKRIQFRKLAKCILRIED